MAITRSNWCATHPFTQYEARDLCPTCAAVFAEREACARTAEGQSFNVFAEWGLNGLVLTRCRNAIADAIRARTDQPTRTPTEPAEG